MKTYSLVLLALFILTACGNGSPETKKSATVSTQDFAEIEASLLPVLYGENVWEIDRATSTLKFTATHNNEDFTGSFGTFGAAIRLDPEAPEGGEIHVLIPIGSIDAGDEDRNANLPTPDWFAAKSYPYARFESSEITKIRTGFYKATGLLSIKGTSKVVSLDFKLSVSPTRAIAKGGVTFSRKDFNIGTGSDFQDEAWVKFPVEVNFVINANRAIPK